MTKRLVTMTTSWSKGLPPLNAEGSTLNIQAEEIWVNGDHPEAVPVTPKKKKANLKFQPQEGNKNHTL